MAKHTAGSSKIVFLLFTLSLYSCLFGCATHPSVEKEEIAGLHLQIANEYIKSENYPAALKELLIAQETSPSSPVVQANLGLVYFMRERYELAQKHYLKAIALKSDFTEAKNNLSRVYIEIGQYKKAEQLLNEVLADLVFSDFPRAQANYGILEFRRKNYSNAIIYLKKSLEKDRENCYTHVYLGRSYLDMANAPFAISQLDKAIPFCEQINSDEAHFYLAIALYRNNQKDQSRFKFEELLRIFPSGYNAEKAQKMLELVKKGAL